MGLDSSVDLVAQTIADLHLLRIKPAANADVLQVVMQTCSQLLILPRVA